MIINLYLISLFLILCIHVFKINTFYLCFFFQNLRTSQKGDCWSLNDFWITFDFQSHGAKGKNFKICSRSVNFRRKASLESALSLTHSPFYLSNFKPNKDRYLKA